MNDTAKTLVTAISKALEQSKPDPAPLTSVLIAELHRDRYATVGGVGTAWRKSNFPNDTLHDGRMVEITELTSWAILQNTAEKLCSPDVFEKLGVLQERMEKILRTSEKYSPENINLYQQEQRDQLEADTLAGTVPAGIVLRSRDAIAEDFRAKQAALYKVLAKISHEEVVPLAKPILLRFEKAVEDFLRQSEEGERELCKSFGVEYKPSIIWKAAVTVAMRYTAETQLPKPSAWRTPKSILDFIIQF